MRTSLVKRFFLADEAATTVEYAILLMVISLAIAKSCQTLGSEMNLVFQETATVIETVVQ